MKKIIQLVLHYIFFISVLLFLPNEVKLYSIILLISILSFEQIYYSILPLIICFYLPLEYSIIILILFTCNLLLYPFTKKNRFYAITIYFLSQLSLFIILFFDNGFSLNSLQILLFYLIIYSLVNILHTFAIIDGKYYILPYNQKLIYLTLILSYLFILLKHSTNELLILFLFMQLFILKDMKYNIIFIGIYTTLFLFFDISYSSIITASAISFFPPIIFLLFSYDNYLVIPLIIYTIVLTMFNFKPKRIKYDDDYINSIFQDFTKYLNQLSYEFDKSNYLQTIKQEKLIEISEEYCTKCQKFSLCKSKLDRRYSFISAAMHGANNNIYDCPHYNDFYVNTNIEIKPSNFEYSGIKALSDELSFLYNQSLALKKDYEYFIGLLDSYGYKTSNIDIHLSSSTLYFTLYFSKEKQIIELLFIKLAYKAFGEKIEIKIINESNRIIVHFYKAPIIKISYAHTILAKDNNLMSGDNYYIKKDYNSSYIFALSDGMGSGYNAYKESSEALKLISTLTSYRFSTKTILKLLEDLYELKSNYDRYATLDFLSINTANRKMNLYKMGSTTTYILHNHQLIAYENKALPLKLDDVNSSYEIDINPGDYVFLLSDGISDFITKEEFHSIVSNGSESVDNMCDNIIQYIKKKEQNELKDDLSLIVIKAI